MTVNVCSTCNKVHCSNDKPFSFDVGQQTETVTLEMSFYYYYYGL